MSRKCSILGVGPMYGHNVSHANNRTKRVFLPNLQNISYISEVMGKIRLRVSVKAHRSILKKGGLDEFLLNTDSRNLADSAVKLKKTLKKRIESQESKA